MKAFCASVNFDAFMVFRPLTSLGNNAETSNLRRGRFLGADHISTETDFVLSSKTGEARQFRHGSSDGQRCFDPPVAPRSESSTRDLLPFAFAEAAVADADSAGEVIGISGHRLQQKQPCHWLVG